MRSIGRLHVLPRPPEGMRFGNPEFAPAPELDEFVRTTFLNKNSALFIEEHEILASAQIGYLWAFPGARDRNRSIAGQAQLIRPPQKKWSSLRSAWQVREWFGRVDYLITLSAPYVLEEASELEVLALIDHELSHCGQMEIEGIPVFHEDGSPIWGMRGHDVEQFIGVTARWGARATGVEQLVAAANGKPKFGDVDVRAVIAGCGTCAQRAA